MRKTAFFLIYLLTVLLFFSCSNGTSGSAIPGIESGRLDLSDWDFTSDGTVKLAGEWFFSWKEFVDPADSMPEDNTSFIECPLYWNQHVHQNQELPGEGWASYRVDIVYPDADLLLGISLKNIHTAYRLYSGSKLISFSGVPGTDKQSTTPAFKKDVAYFSPDQKESSLTLHIANFHLQEGGFWENITLGDAVIMSNNSAKSLALEIMLISCIFAMAIYHMGIFINRPEDKASLFFSIFCFLIAVRALTTGEIFIEKLIPGMPFAVMVKIEYFCFYAALPSFILYQRALFPKETHKIMITVIIAAAVIFIFQVLLTSPHTFNGTLEIYQAVTAISAIYIIIILIRAIFRKRQNSIILLAGFVVLFATFVNDVLHANEVINTGLILPAGLFVFIFSQAILILNRSSIAYRTVESQKNELILSHDRFKRSRLGTILGLAKLAEYRDEDTGKHLERIREYCKLITQRLAEKEEYKDYITKKYINDIYQSSILHDIGKVGVPDSILLKKGKLDLEEFEYIKKHTIIGGDALENIEAKTEMKTFLTLGKEIAWFHHEKWDGSGYPKGLSGSKIPLSARITSVADVYDALTSERPYKKAFSHEKARDIITEGRGSHFDPLIVDIFLENDSEFNRIRFEHQED